MKALPLLLLVTILLSGCRTGSLVESNYRAVEDMQLVQTFGYDREDGAVTVTVSSGRGPESVPLSLLSASAPDIPQAIEGLQGWSAREDLFFAHIRYILVGEEAAREGLEELLDWFERSTQTRLELPVFVVEGGSAREAMEGAGEELFEITASLLSLERSLERRGGAYPFTLREMGQRQGRSGCALCAAVRLEEAEGHAPEASGCLSVQQNGFAVLQDWQLRGFAREEAARGICLLLNRAGKGSLRLPCGVTLTLRESRARLRGLRQGDGSLLLISLRGRGSVSAAAPGAPAGEAAADWEFTRKLRREAEAALRLSRRLEADFLELGPALRRGGLSPGDWQSVPVRWEVSGRAERSYDLLSPRNAAEETGHGK